MRRVALPDAFFAIDGLFETFLTVLDEFGAFPAVIQRELDRYLPFLATTKVLMAAVRAGVGRETAHEAIKEHAVAVALEMREGRTDNDLFDRLAGDPRLGLDRADIAALVAEPIEFTGAARSQVEAVVAGWARSSPATPTPRRTPRARSSARPERHAVRALVAACSVRRCRRYPASAAGPACPRAARTSALVADSRSGRRSTTIVPPGSSFTSSASSIL